MAAAASSNSASGRRGGRYAKQRVTWSRYGSGVAGERRGLRLERDELGVQPGPPVGVGDLAGQPRRAGPRRPRAAVAGERPCSMSTWALSSAGPK